MATAWTAAHGITADDYQARFNALVQQQFRLRWVNAYGDDRQPRFNTVWEKAAGAAWEARHGIADRDYQAHFLDGSRQGLRLRCVSAYVDAGAISYATLWDREPSPGWESYHGIPDALYQQHFDSMARRNFRLVHLDACGRGAEAIFATIWEQQQGPAWEARHGLGAADWQAEFEALTRRGFSLRRVAAYAVAGQARYAGIWQAGPALPWQARHGRDAAAHQLDFDDLRFGGYRPSCVSGCTTAAGARFAAVYENHAFGGATLDMIEREATGFMGRNAVPGFSIAISAAGRLVYAQALGHADAARTEPLRTRHRMRSASLAKPLTSVAIHRLRERGLLGLDDAVFGEGGLLGTRLGTQPYGANLLAIRVRHLLEHSSGAWDNQGPGTAAEPNPRDFDGLGDPMFRFPARNHDQLIGGVLDTYPVDPPGTRHAYSNFGYCLLGRIIAACSGQAYDTFVRQDVLAPAGAAGIAISGNTRAERQDWEVEYVGQGGENPYDMNVARMDAHGGWLGTAIDHLRFAVHVDGAGGRPALLNRGSLATMLTPPALSPRYAQGWAVNEAPNRWHTGSLPGTRALMVTAANGMSWVALCNTRAPAGWADDAMGDDLDATMWRIIEGVPGWPDHDLF